MIAGTGLGSGVMAIPFLFKSAGLSAGIVAFLIAFVVSICIHYMIADMVLNASAYEITTIFQKLLLRGKQKKAMSIVFFVTILIMIVVNLSTYVLGGAEVIASLLGVSLFASKIIFYVVSFLPVLFGLKVIAIGEKYLVCAIMALVVYFTVLSFANQNGSISLGGHLPAMLSVFSMAMFSMSALFAVPELARGMNRDAKKIKKSITLGLIINILVSSLICFSVIVSSHEVTEMAAVGWSRSLGSVMQGLSAVFILFAMMTSFWVVSISFSNMVHVQFRLNMKICYCIATFPSLLIAFIPFASFSDFAKMTSGVISICMSIMLIPAYLNSIKLTSCSPLLGKWGSKKLFLGSIMAANLLMAIGALY